MSDTESSEVFEQRISFLTVLIRTHVHAQIAVELCEDLLARHHNKTKANLRVLDFGCGVGMSTLAISSAFRQQVSVNATVIGIDTSPEMLAMARAKDLERKGISNLSHNHCGDKRDAKHRNNVDVSFVEANAENTPF
jgi:ubiquinone/menaquinone biosynthesis C-methylase UbiE